MNVRRKKSVVRKTFESESESLTKHETKKVSLRNNEKKFPSATIFRFFKQAAILNDKKQELKLLITVVAAN